MNDDKAPYIIFLAICHLMALLLFCLILLRIAYLLFRKKNPNRAEKVVSIAIVAVIFNRTFQEAVISPIELMVMNTQKLFYIFYANAYADNVAKEGGNTKILTEYTLNERIISVQKIFDNFPLARLFTAIALVFLIYYFILYLKRNFATDKKNEVDTPAGSSILIYNAIISFILLLSLFLVISVCITIPYLNQASKPTPFTFSRLDTTLNAYSSRDSLVVAGVSNSPFPESSVRDLIFTDTIQKTFARFTPTDQDKINERINDYEQIFSLIKTERFNTVSNLERAKKTYKTRENTYKRNLSINFEKETQSIMVDKGELFQSSVRYFSDFVQNETEGFKSTLQLVNSSDDYNRIANKEGIKKIQDVIFDFAKNGNRDSSYNLYGSLFRLVPNFLPYQSYFAANPTETYIPTFVKNGSEWGFFGFMANYLIKTQSSELVLLMGMFGFGLLGASLLSFRKIRNNGNFITTFKTELLILNFGNVLARGFGAALVIYLATKGGLAIFSSGTTTDTNGYILLLTCFVGAVFSDKVWSKIRKNLNLDDEHNPKTQK